MRGSNIISRLKCIFANVCLINCSKERVVVIFLITSHVPIVAHAAVPRLARALIGPGLQADLAVPALLDLLLSEVPLVLGRHLGPDLRPGVPVQDKVLISNAVIDKPEFHNLDIVCLMCSFHSLLD